VLLALVLAAGLLLAGCGGGHDPRPARAAAGCSLPAGGSTLTIATDGHPLDVLVHVPPRAAGALPVVVAFHYATGTGPAMEEVTGLSRLADRERFLAVYPDTTGARRLWDLRGPGDVRITALLLDKLAATGCLDAGRVFATGVSNGGGMAALAACRLAGRVAAAASVAGGYRAFSTCPGLRAAPVSLLELHGTGDRIAPYRDAERFVRAWASADRCHVRPRVRGVGFGAVRFEWGGCRAGVAVEHVRIARFGHGWPGDGPPIQGAGSRFPATTAIWRFFAAHPRRP
jgi:polyhydroxybutyrate depolymerase